MLSGIQLPAAGPCGNIFNHFSSLCYLGYNYMLLVPVVTYLITSLPMLSGIQLPAAGPCGNIYNILNPALRFQSNFH